MGDYSLCSPAWEKESLWSCQPLTLSLSCPQAALQVGGHGERLTQCREVLLTTSKAIPVQVDGEPCKLAASRIRIALRNQATMVQKAKRRSAAPLHSEYVPPPPPTCPGPQRLCPSLASVFSSGKEANSTPGQLGRGAVRGVMPGGDRQLGQGPCQAPRGPPACSQQPVPEQLRVQVSRVSMHDYEALHYDKEQLKEACEWQAEWGGVAEERGLGWGAARC